MAIAAAGAVFAGAAPAAFADARYASPTGSAGATCSSGDPCRLDTAVNGAAGGEEVVLKPGDYNVTFPVEATAAIDIHGQAGESVPRLLGGAGLTTATLEMSAGGSISRVYASSSANSVSAFALDDVIADGIESRATNGAYGTEIYASLSGTVLRNSVARADGSGAAIQVKDRLVGSATILGVTAHATGGADGIVVKATLSTTTVKNTIARGTNWDIETKPTALAPIVSYSNVRPGNTSATVGPGNQDGAPLFFNEAAGDLRPVAGSPTIDGGAADALAGLKDALGLQRVWGAAPDIGALEFDPAHPPVLDTPTGGTGGTPSGSTTTTGDSAASTGPGGGGDTPDGGAGGQSDDLPPETQPVLGATVTLGEVKGAPLVRLPGTDRFVPLTRDSTVPVGAVVDATNGTVELTSVRDSSGKTQTGTFWGGVFKVAQSRRDTVTELALSGGDFSDCKATKRRGRGKVVAAGAKRKRRLWGRDRGGRFRTRGRHASATVRGTRWLTEDRCDGTYFKVTQGAIDVRDERKRKTVRLKRGGSYLAAAAPAKRKRSR
jgi:hypothetical protein